MTDPSAAIVYFTYEGTADDRFDRDYYVDVHLPLVRERFVPYGLTRIAAFYPPVAERGTIAIAELQFRDDASADAAFASPEFAELIGDVATFTELRPNRFRGVPF